jgi:hypothetical protein
MVVLAICRVGVGQTGWAEPNCAYRRPVTVAWNSDSPTGREMAMVDCLTDGHANADGGDVRVTTADGREIPSRVLMTGPGDSVRVLFPLVAGMRGYEIYFGDPHAGSAEDISTMPITCGLLAEMRAYNGPLCGDAQSMEPAWNGAGPTLGRTMAELPFIAGCPLGNQRHVMLRYSGQLIIPADGQYIFAGSARNRGALYIDGQPIIYVPDITWHADYCATLALTRGRHDFVFYQIYTDGFEVFSVDWRVPEATDYKPITRDYFGIVSYGRTSDVESRDGKPIADFAAEYQASADFDGNVTHRYTFSSAGADPNAQWDFGDGQTGTGAAVDHIYLADGVYPVKIRQRGDEEMTRLAVHLDWANEMDPSVDLPWAQGKIVAGYDLNKIPEGVLGTAALMELDTQNWAVAGRLCVLVARSKGHNPDGIGAANSALQHLADKETNWRTAARLWSLVPDDSDLQPYAAVACGELLIWTGGDFAGAVEKLGSQVGRRPNDPALERAYAHALILNQQPDAGRKILISQPISDDPRRLPAISGACARTVEYYLEQGDVESAQAAWDDWDSRDPAGFLEGYSILLRVRLMEQEQKGQNAAAVAEAFATAMPDSAYSPELLDRASKLLAGIDPAHSQRIRDLLKQRYPEDELSQK